MNALISICLVSIAGLAVTSAGAQQPTKMDYHACKAQGGKPAECRQYLSPEGRAQVERSAMARQREAAAQKATTQKLFPKSQK